MNSFRPYLSALAIAIGLTLSAQSPAQSAPLPYSLQGDPQIPRITSKQQQDEAIALFTQHLELRAAGAAAYDGIVTPDAVFEYPYANDESVRRVQGSTAIADGLRKLGGIATDWKFSDVRLFETPHPDIFFVQYRATANIPGSNRIFEQRYLARITVKQGRIAEYYELWDRVAQQAAFSPTAQQ